MDDAAASSSPFDEGLRRKILLFPRCQACGRFHWYPMPRCPYCRSEMIAWTPSSGRGVIFTCTLVEHGFDPTWKALVPYSVALVEFADAPGIRLVSLLVGNPPPATAVGSAVEPVFDLAGDRPRVLFKVVAPGAAPPR
jgi:uncharacterized OB-fold protein